MVSGEAKLVLVVEDEPAIRDVISDLLAEHGWAFMECYLEKTDDEPIPIVVVSVNPALPRSFNRFGVRAVVAKPFDIDLLVAAVEQACSSGRSQAA